MALSAVTFKPSDKPDAELSTIKEEQPLLEEQYLEKASVHLDNRLFIATTGTLALLALPSILFHRPPLSSIHLTC